VTETEKRLVKPQIQQTERRCPFCAALPRLLHAMLDTRRGRIVSLYQCKCGERIWDEQEPTAKTVHI
jgi:glutaredoxin